MLSKFWEAFGEGIAQKWLEQLGAAFIFWLLGIFLTFGRDGFLLLSQKYVALDVIQQAAILVILFVVFSLTSAIVSNLNNVGLRILEGYWPSVFHLPASWFISQKRKAWEQNVTKWQTLRRKIDEDAATNYERN